MRRDRPAPREQPGFACGQGSSSSLHLASAARYAFRLTEGRRRSSFPGADPAYLGNIGLNPVIVAQGGLGCLNDKAEPLPC
jgi:hypothetical protein